MRSLPQYDNLALGHADRSRIVPPGMVGRPYTQLWVGSFLVDGFAAGLWRIGDRPTPLRMDSGAGATQDSPERRKLVAEAEGLLAFLRPESATVKFVDRIP